jgi:ABC-2 type transport system ATP-binding protein
MNAIELENIHKHYKNTHALNGLNLNIQAGQLFGLVGVNGAGKTTTLSTIMGFIRASSGTARVLGLDPWQEAPALHAKIAWLPGDVRLPDAQTGQAWLTYQAQVLNLETNKIHDLGSEWEVPLNRPMRTLSKGNRQKVALLRLLASNAPLLILDEPTSGLDPVAQERLLLALRQRAQNGTTVLFSSHSLSEVQTLCDQIAVIDKGKVVRQGGVAALTGQKQVLGIWSKQPLDFGVLQSWKIKPISSHHCLLEGENLLEKAIPQLLQFGIERLEFGGMGLEQLLEQAGQAGLEQAGQAGLEQAGQAGLEQAGRTKGAA